MWQLAKLHHQMKDSFPHAKNFYLTLIGVTVSSFKRDLNIDLLLTPKNVILAYYTEKERLPMF